MGTHTSTFTVEEKFVLDCFEHATSDELQASSILSRGREAREVEGEDYIQDEEILTCLGQLIERGLISRTKRGDDGKFLYRRN